MEVAMKPRRSVVKKQKREAAKLARQQNGAEAILKNVPTSPRKMRLVADLIRGEKVSRALSVLKFQTKSGAKKLEKLLLSAISNWQSRNEDKRLEEADLFVKEIFVDEGRMLKRLRPAPQGRGHRIRKRSNHITLVIDSLTFPGSVKAIEKDAEESEVKEKSSKKATVAKVKKTETKAKATKAGAKKTKNK